jgi:predicted lipoprotein with Yx(FWY)xxD motif
LKRLGIIAVVGVAALAAGVGVAIAIASTNGGSTHRHATVSAKHIAGAGTVLVDSKGRTLYANAQDHGGKLLCTGACLSFWKPLIVSAKPTAASSLSGKLGVVKRADGRRQVTFNLTPLYTFTLDKPGQATGNGVKDAFGGRGFTWHVVHPNGSAATGVTTTPTPTYSIPGY